MPKTSKTNAEYSAEMRRRLLRVARREFARSGFADTGTERIVRLAKVTRGTLYHHYTDKRALFEAVFEELAAELAERIEARAASARDPFEALVAGCEAWLDACLDEEVQRILLIDGPAVLGWKTWSEIDSRHGTRSLREGIDACQGAGALKETLDPTALTRLLAGALNDVALHLADTEDATNTRRKIGKTLRVILNGLRQH